MFRPGKLVRDLEQKDAAPILEEAGYEPGDCVGCIRRLIDRLHAGGEFPHEIGLFLGYPPEDVRGFIDNRAKTSSSSATGRSTATRTPPAESLKPIKNAHNAIAEPWARA